MSDAVGALDALVVQSGALLGAGVVAAVGIAVALLVERTDIRDVDRAKDIEIARLRAALRAEHLRAAARPIPTARYHAPGPGAPALTLAEIEEWAPALPAWLTRSAEVDRGLCPMATSSVWSAPT